MCREIQHQQHNQMNQFGSQKSMGRTHSEWKLVVYRQHEMLDAEILMHADIDSAHLQILQHRDRSVGFFCHSAMDTRCRVRIAHSP